MTASTDKWELAAFDPRNTWSLVAKLQALPYTVRPNVLLVGPPGTGKTFLGGVLAQAEELPFYNVTVNGRTLPSDLLFAPWIQGAGDAVLQFRPGLQAWGVGGHAPGYLVVNEINEASEDALLALGALLDDPESARIALPTGDTVRPAGAFRCVATSNASVRDLPERLLDRFRVRILVDSPAPPVLDQLQDDTRAAIVAVYAGLGWTLDKTGEAPLLSVREALAFDQMRKHVGVQAAASLIWGERADAIRDHIKLAARAARVVAPAEEA